MPHKVQPIFNIQNVKPYNNKDLQKYLRPSASSKGSTIYNLKNRKSSRASKGCATIKSWFVKNLSNFCNTTSLHGFNYISRTDLSRNERIFWFVIVIISILVSIALVAISYVSNRETPTVTVIESSHYPTWNIPFPAVTFCNFNKISKTQAVQLAKVLKRPPNTTEEDVLNSFLVAMHYSFALNFEEVNYTLAEQILKMNNMTLAQLSESITPNCLYMISKCIWKGMNSRCDSLFQRVQSMTFGECCSFNYFGREKNNFPQKILYQVPKRPYRVTGCGYPTGLSILLNPFAYDYFASSFSSYGFRLLIHDSYNAPDENAETKIISSTRESFIHINPESTYATNDIRGMDIKLRNCLFSYERKLQVMRSYSFTNCMWECRIKYIMYKCRCVPHNLPNNGSYPTCDIQDFKCLMESKAILTSSLSEYNSTLPVMEDVPNLPCNCLPACQSNRYMSEITMGRLNIKLQFNNDNIDRLPNDTNNILLHIFFSDLMSTRYRKEVYENWLAALASFGGLLGLIMGFSIVTAFEFVYFLTFRPVFDYFTPQ